MDTTGHGEQAYADKHHLPRQYAEKLLIIEEGRGVRLRDAAGKEYLDFASGIAVNALGYGRKDFADLISRQAGKLVHISNLFTTRPALDLAEKFCSSSPLPEDQPWSRDRNPGYFASVHFGNSGTEANETAIKYARGYQHRKGKNRPGILAFADSFHGRTMGALSVTATKKYRTPFEPLIPGARFGVFNDVADLRRRLRGCRGRKTGVVIVEPIQGEGGIIAMKPDFARALNEICAERDIVLIADEVQTGLGRCGTLFASEGAGLRPDIITLSKPLAGGLPLSATLVKKRIHESIKPGDHASTFGGGPVTTAAAGLVWDEITRPGFLEGVNATADYLGRRLEAIRDDHPGFFIAGEAPRGRGMLRGLAVRDGEALPGFIAECMEEGLLVLRAGTNILRMAPPLVIENNDIDELESILRRVLKRRTA